MRGSIREHDAIKTGTSGRKARVEQVLWVGTAEVFAEELVRLPAAVVQTTRGPMAAIQLAGCPQEQWAWWDARLLNSREWEDSYGELLAEADPELAAVADRFLQSWEPIHEQRSKELLSRVRRGTYGITQPTDSTQ